MITAEKPTADYFEAVVSEIGSKKKSEELAADAEKAVRLAANYLVTELRKRLADLGKTIDASGIAPENYAEFIAIVADGKINSSAAQTVLGEMLQGGDNDPSHIIERLNLGQVSDTGELEGIVAAVLSANSKSVEDFRAGKQNAFQFLIGQVMSASRGKANPKMVSEILRGKLES